MAVDIDLDVHVARVAASLAAELADVYARMASVFDEDAGGDAFSPDAARQLLGLQSRVERIEIEIAAVRAACLVDA